jgi:hypothetical protein
MLLEKVLQVEVEVGDRCVNSDLVLPFEIGPHLSEFSVGAGGWNNVVHDINVDVIKDNYVTIRRGSRYIINNVAENNAVLGRSHLDSRKSLG